MLQNNIELDLKTRMIECGQTQTEVAEKAKISCENNGIAVTDHFADVSKMIKIGKGGNREVDDYMRCFY